MVEWLSGWLSGWVSGWLSGCQSLAGLGHCCASKHARYAAHVPNSADPWAEGSTSSSMSNGRTYRSRLGRAGHLHCQLLAPFHHTLQCSNAHPSSSRSSFVCGNEIKQRAAEANSQRFSGQARRGRRHGSINTRACEDSNDGGGGARGGGDRERE